MKLAKRIIGIDPGLTKTGMGIIEIDGQNMKFIASSTIYTSPNQEMPDRLRHFHFNLSKFICEFKPSESAIEETFVNKNPVSSLKLGHARGALILSLGLSDLPVFQYSSTAVKKAVVGVGRAEKEQVQAMVKMLLSNKGREGFKNEDEADALAVAICHFHNQTWINYTKNQ